jgi:hypothetical protein
MHALTVFRLCLGTLLVSVHRKRLSTLFEAVAACVSGPRLTLTDIGRRLMGNTSLRYGIKRADRLLGNINLQQETTKFYGALCIILLAKIREPTILIDWSDLKKDQSIHLLRASLAVGGRSLTLYEETHPQKLLGNPDVQKRFLDRLSTLLPEHVSPIIIADSGFKVPFYKQVERLGWRWVGRVRGRDYLHLDQCWISCKALFQKATSTPTLLGLGEWVRSNPISALLVLVRHEPKGRSKRTASGKRSRSKASKQHARAAKEPWLLATSSKLGHLSAKQLVQLYRRRMQIEASFRDMKSQHFGVGLECSRSQGVGRLRVLVLIASLAAFLLWLLGTAAERSGLHRKLYPSNGERRVYSKLFIGRLLLVLERCRDDLDLLVKSISDVEQWIAFDHNPQLFE